MSDPATLATASDVDQFARAIYGAPLGAMQGVLHVVAIAEQNGARAVIRIGPRAPKSPTDLTVLNLARARVEAILVTGAVLRAEPELRYELAGPGTSARALAEWRRDVARLSRPPFLLVLTRGDLPLGHPALSSWAIPIVFTTREAAERMRGEAPCEVVGHDAPSTRAALEHLHRRGCRSVSIEAGPSTAVPLYDPPAAVDELALSVFEGALDPDVRGGAFPSEREIASAGLERTREPARRIEPSGTWRFERWTRAS